MSPTERRVGDRRSARRAPTADESWFGAFGSDEDTGYGPEIAPGGSVTRRCARTASRTDASDAATARSGR